VAMNPKMDGSGLVECIPQTGLCPNDCEHCFYNGEQWYRTREEPLLPSVEEAVGKVVRMNSGHDSNIEREKVLAVAGVYRHVFMNTSIAEFDFGLNPWTGVPYPVVFTCNGREPLFVDVPPHVMYVRVRAKSWDLCEQDDVVDHYVNQGAVVVLTWMNYPVREAIPDMVMASGDYEERVHVANRYWRMTPSAMLDTLGEHLHMRSAELVRTCGTLWSSMCKDCGNCETLYWETLRRLGWEGEEGASTSTSTSTSKSTRASEGGEEDEEESAAAPRRMYPEAE